MDDFTPYGCDFQEAVSNLGRVMNKCIEMNLSLSPKKCEFLMTAGIVLDHSISHEGVQVDPNKITIIKRVSTPKKQRDVRIFLGLAKYYRRLIKDFSKLTSPLFGLLAKYSEFLWLESCQESLDTLKDKLTTTPILRGPNWALPFHIHVDASHKAIGETLGQIDDKIPYAIYFIISTKCVLQRKEQSHKKVHPIHLDWGQSLQTRSNQILSRCVREEEVFDILLACHDGPCGGHFATKRTTVKFGYPKELVIDQGSQLTSHVIEDLLSQHKIKHRTSTPYHPQANGQVEVTNRALEGILTKVISSNGKDWADRLVEATWAYNTTWRTTTNFNPYELVYGKKVLLSIEFEYNTLSMAAQLDLDITRAQQERLLQLNGLDQFRMQALLHTEVTQVQRKIWHDKNIKDKLFQEGDQALLYDSRYKDFKGKLKTRWLGLYVIEKRHDNGVVQIRTIDA
eukprot:PITA_26537